MRKSIYPTGEPSWRDQCLTAPSSSHHPRRGTGHVSEKAILGDPDRGDNPWNRVTVQVSSAQTTKLQEIIICYGFKLLCLAQCIIQELITGTASYERNCSQTLMTLRIRQPWVKSVPGERCGAMSLTSLHFFSEKVGPCGLLPHPSIHAIPRWGSQFYPSSRGGPNDLEKPMSVLHRLRTTQWARAKFVTEPTPVRMTLRTSADNMNNLSCPSSQPEHEINPHSRNYPTKGNHGEKELELDQNAPEPRTYLEGFK